MKISLKTLILAIALIFLSNCAGKDNSRINYEAERLVNDSLNALKDIIYTYKEDSKFVNSLRNASGVLIIPSLFKAGLVIGGEAGKGVALVRGGNGNWTYPSFYNFVNLDIGISFGLEFSSILYIFEEPHDMDSFLRNRFVFKPEFSVAMFTVGRTFHTTLPITSVSGGIAFALNQGFYVGGNLGFGGIAPLDNYSQSFYQNSNATSDNVIYTGRYSNLLADKLRAELNYFN